MSLSGTSFLEEQGPDALFEGESCELGETTSMSGSALAGGDVELATAESAYPIFEKPTGAQLARVKG